MPSNKFSIRLRTKWLHKSKQHPFYMKNIVAITGSIALLLAASLIQPPSAEARFQGVNEKKWAKSIEADINNGAPADAICINASNSAQVSDEAAFKNWAYSIAREYCSSGYKKRFTSSSRRKPVKLSGDCAISPNDLYRLERSKLIIKNGSYCFLFISSE